MIEVIFLSILAIIWMIAAVSQDLRTRIVANWINFSLIIFALGFRFFYSLFSGQGFGFFYQGLIGLGIFFILGNAFYYGKMFAGGDAKLMIALGTILPFTPDFFINIRIFILFFILFLFSGAIYGLGWSAFLSIRNFKKFKVEFGRQFKLKWHHYFLIMFFGLFIMLGGFVNVLFFYLGIFIFILPYFYVFAKAVDESCLIRKIKTRYLTEGDWLYKDLKLGRKIIRASWEGLSQKEISLIRKQKNQIEIREGIPFTPVFLTSFLVLVYVVLTILN